MDSKFPGALCDHALMVFTGFCQAEHVETDTTPEREEKSRERGKEGEDPDTDKL